MKAPEFRAYYLHVGSGTASGPFNDPAATSFQRFRLMTDLAVGPLRFDIAYEHGLEVSTGTLVPGGLAGVGARRGTGAWAPLQWTIEESDHVLWRHQFDRLSGTLTAGESVELSLGRQTISWATTLFLTPADPFVPFNPEDPFREFRAGVDAARLRAFLGPFTDVDFVFRPATYDDETTLTALGRVRSVIGGVELGAWLGALHDEFSASGAVTATLLGAAVRAELVVREAEGETVFRGAFGIDRAFGLGERDLYVVAEYQRDGFGAADASELLDVLGSTPASRGELLVLGRDALALQASMQLHALWTVDALALTNLGDPSLLFGPGVTYSLSDEGTARGGLYLGAGDPKTGEGLPGSEYGAVPFTAYLSVTFFF
ncbi:MAG: hypothetical protein OEU54_09410 [Gemmatimonadota bacterium]|nr:hypothetical protein [Gemmatimonadota bacterium]